MYLVDLIWPLVGALNKKIPAAAVRQDDHHLHVYIDSIPPGELVRQTERELSDRALFTPNVTCEDPELFGFIVGKAHRGGVIQERTKTGQIGSPLHATAQTGEKLSASSSTGVQRFRNRVEQWDGKGW